MLVTYPRAVNLSACSSSIHVHADSLIDEGSAKTQAPLGVSREHHTPAIDSSPATDTTEADPAGSASSAVTHAKCLMDSFA